MAEWLILLLLVPAIVVPVVLLVGFAGCDRLFGLETVHPPETTFDETGAFSRDATPWEGFTLVQRIEPGGLTPTSRTFLRVTITLFAATMSDASIDRIFISGPASTKDWDPGNDLTQVPLPSTPFVVPAGKSVTLGPVSYQVRPPSSDGTDPGRALLIAVDFSVPPTASGVRAADQVPPDRAVAWWFQYFRPPPGPSLPPEAALPTRSPGYTSSPNVYLIGKIEIV
jgi:hypothetical protein